MTPAEDVQKTPKLRSTQAALESRGIETKWMRERKEYIRKHNLHRLLGDLMDGCLCKPDSQLPDNPTLFLAESIFRVLLQSHQTVASRKALFASESSVKALNGLHKTLSSLLNESPQEALRESLQAENNDELAGCAQIPRDEIQITPPQAQSVNILQSSSFLLDAQPKVTHTDHYVEARETENGSSAAVATEDVTPVSAVDEQPKGGLSPTAAGDACAIETAVSAKPSEPPAAPSSLPKAVASNSIKEPVRCEWEETLAQNGKRLWYNSKTKVKTWEKPKAVAEREQDSTSDDWCAVQGESSVWYYNTRTGMKQWHKPENFRGTQRTIASSSAAPKARSPTPEARALSENWTVYTRDDGPSYYICNKTKMKQWAKPDELVDPILIGTGWAEHDYQGTSYYVHAGSNVCLNNMLEARHFQAGSSPGRSEAENRDGV
ncbi:hypothetical protein DIPPA_54932 [Diplonema papillatum]|nr:hypothetical protein DIPPA_54932 [Diplonema papillatum]